ncbi:hypothetical protein J1N35_015013 [Gossypium stocksii]|uniref:Reverse transcriptase Ty1/copia-type domain-containing protein n=1 Tax=Gossypium stocksii TaxID=47602 RepID=A0A9D4AAF9_9ROSI|nr:hypothetical protein J1N35_015013 [Gossypium stocksii]
MAIEEPKEEEYCFKVSNSKKNSWYLDSGCSRHMISDKSHFMEPMLKNKGEVTFGDNSKKLVECIGSIAINSSTLIKNMFYVNGIKHNLLSISQRCDKLIKNELVIGMPNFPIDFDKVCDACAKGTKWVFKNKLDENGNFVRNKSRLVAKGYSQEEDIDNDESYASVARLEVIRMLLAFVCSNNFKLFQMDVKSAFLNGFINGEVYIEKPPDFENPNFPNHVFKLSKALYGLKQSPRAWYERLSKVVIENGFRRGKVDTTLFIKTKEKDILVVQIYVDNIIFGTTNELLCQKISKIMQGEFKEMLEKFKMEDLKPQSTPMSISTKLDKDEEDFNHLLRSYIYKPLRESLGSSALMPKTKHLPN